MFSKFFIGKVCISVYISLDFIKVTENFKGVNRVPQQLCGLNNKIVNDRDI